MTLSPPSTPLLPLTTVEGQSPERCGHCKRTVPCNRHLLIEYFQTEYFIPLCDICSDDLDVQMMELSLRFTLRLRAGGP